MIQPLFDQRRIGIKHCSNGTSVHNLCGVTSPKFYINTNYFQYFSKDDSPNNFWRRLSHFSILRRTRKFSTLLSPNCFCFPWFCYGTSFTSIETKNYYNLWFWRGQLSEVELWQLLVPVHYSHQAYCLQYITQNKAIRIWSRRKNKSKC